MSTFSIFPANLEHLIARAKRGDRNALASVVTHFEPRFVAALRSRYNVSEADAQDLCGDLCLMLFTKGISPKVHTPASFWGYYLKSLRRMRIYNLKLKSSKTISLDMLTEGQGGERGMDADYLACLEDTDSNNDPTHFVQHHDLYTAIACLTSKQQKVLRQFYFDGQTTCKIAEEMGIPESTLKSDLRRMRVRLSQMLQQDQQTQDRMLPEGRYDHPTGESAYPQTARG
jgi:RNA polymerase sigma factor (sigma-70 family)